MLQSYIHTLSSWICHTCTKFNQNVEIMTLIYDNVTLTHFETNWQLYVLKRKFSNDRCILIDTYFVCTLYKSGVLVST